MYLISNFISREKLSQEIYIQNILSINLKTYYLKACNLYANYSQFTITTSQSQFTTHNSQSQFTSHHHNFTAYKFTIHKFTNHNSQPRVHNHNLQFTEVDKYLKLINKLRHYAFMETVKPKTAYLNLV